MKDLATASKELTRQASQNVQTKSQGKSLPSTESRTDTEKIRQIATIVRQCFDIQNTYGKTPEQLKTLQKAMIEDLKPYRLSDIEQAFVEWRQESPNIPAPANILKIITGYIRAESRQAYTPPPGREHFPTEEEKLEVSEMVAQCKKNLTTEDG